MYKLAPWKKQDPVARWNLPDRIFFGHGACHILAGVFLQQNIQASFKAFWIKPKEHSGNHVFVSDAEIAFDYHGYSVLDRLKQHHRKVWQQQYPTWEAGVVLVNFDLLDTRALNQRNMRGPDQYQGDAVLRAKNYLARVEHSAAAESARLILSNL